MQFFLFIYVFLSFTCCDSSLAKDYVISRQKNEKILESKYITSPIGDNVNVEVYSFITDFLLKQRFVSTVDLEKIIKNEVNLLNIHSTDKPFIAEIFEGEFANILRALCYYKNGCKQITIYQQNGIGVADTGFIQELNFINKQDLYIKIGLLGINPKEKLGIYTSTSALRQKYYEIIKAIYYNQENKYAYLAFEPMNNNHKLIGYVRYIMK
jgi:hypothetical protein